MEIVVTNHTPLGAAIAAAGVCRNSGDPEAALRHALEAGHDSLLEHWVISFQVDGISRACAQQLTRHRIGWSYAMQSQRHVRVAEGHDWYVTPPDAPPLYHHYIEAARQGYIALLKAGVPMEDARYVLPGACKTSLVCTANGRALDAFFHLRVCKRAQWEIRGFAEALLKECRARAKELFVGPYPDCENCKEGC